MKYPLNGIQAAPSRAKAVFFGYFQIGTVFATKSSDGSYASMRLRRVLALKAAR